MSTPRLAAAPGRPRWVGVRGLGGGTRARRGDRRVLGPARQPTLVPHRRRRGFLAGDFLTPARGATGRGSGAGRRRESALIVWGWRASARRPWPASVGVGVVRPRWRQRPCSPCAETAGEGTGAVRRAVPRRRGRRNWCTVSAGALYAASAPGPSPCSSSRSTGARRTPGWPLSQAAPLRSTLFLSLGLILSQTGPARRRHRRSPIAARWRMASVSITACRAPPFSRPASRGRADSRRRGSRASLQARRRARPAATTSSPT